MLASAEHRIAAVRLPGGSRPSSSRPCEIAGASDTNFKSLKSLGRVSVGLAVEATRSARADACDLEQIIDSAIMTCLGGSNANR